MADVCPAPRAVTPLDGAARLADGLLIGAPPELAGVARWFVRELEAATGWAIRTEGPEKSGAACIRLTRATRPGMADSLESYLLRVDRDGVEIVAPSPAGAFYGLQTLRQLLPADCWRLAPSSGGRRGRPRPPVELDGVEILDGPAFAWRGVHLDVARHFMPKRFLFRLVDLAAAHKCNVVHLHLTDDQGWRMEVEGWPRLTEVGAWRRESMAGYYTEGRFDGVPHGGFYTRADLGELVAYAEERFVTVLPEVDMPGHMRAAIAAYPELGSGEPADVWTSWGISDRVLNLEESTVRFCCEVLDEVAEVFPGRYVHVGGDECPTREWRESARAAELMARGGFARHRELQGWFTARIASHVESLDRVLVGWDEILGAGAPPGSVVMSWRGEEGGLEAARAGFDTVMAPQQWLYFDWAQAADEREPLAIHPGTATTLERVLSFRPVPAALDEEAAAHVLGAQCQLWTEYVPTPEHAEYMYFPRLVAFAETAWSPEPPDPAEFERRLRPHLARLDALGVNYRPLEGPTPGQARTW